VFKAPCTWWNADVQHNPSKRRHDRTLPEKKGHLSAKNLVVRLLYITNVLLLVFIDYFLFHFTSFYIVPVAFWQRSLHWMRLHDWRIISVDLTTPPTRWSVFTGCACQSEFSSRFPYWRTKSYTDLRHNTLVRSTALPTCLAVDLFVLPTPTAWWCRRSGCQLLPTELSRWSAHKSGMIYRLTWRPLNRLPHSASDWKLTFFQNHFPATSWALTNFPGH